MDIRFLRADGAWMGPGGGLPVGRLVVTMVCVTRVHWAAPRYRAFTVMEDVFLRHHGTPHLAKRFAASREALREMFPHLDRFVGCLDPDGKFLNQYLAALFA
jgi:hypothetical protein